jgi:transcriptional regulator with XRE-family HTH domain
MPTTQLNTFGKRLRQARLCRGLSQKQFAEVLGVKQSIVSRWEIGETNSKLATIQRLAASLSVSPDWLAFGGPLPSSVTASDEEVG